MDVADSAIKQAKSDASFSVNIMYIVIGTGFTVMIVLSIFIARSIGKVLKTVISETARLSQDAVEGKLQALGDIHSVILKFRPIVEGINATMDSLITLIDGVTAPFFIINKDFEILYVNDITAKLLEIPRNKIYGTKCYEQQPIVPVGKPCATIRLQQWKRKPIHAG